MTNSNQSQLPPQAVCVMWLRTKMEGRKVEDGGGSGGSQGSSLDVMRDCGSGEEFGTYGGP